MRVAILSARSGWHTDELCRALAARGHEGRVLPYERLVGRLGVGCDGLASAGEQLEAASAVLTRIIPAGSLEQIIFRVDALHRLEEQGVPVVNSPRTIERTVDKFWTTSILQSAGLAVPETIVCEHPDDALAAFRALGDVIVKPLFGSMGLGMVRVSDADMALRVARTLESIRGVYYLQRAIDHDGRDVRAFVVGERVIGAIERRAPRGEWRTNLARGGEARALDLDPEWAALALRAARAVGAEYAGVDLLPARDGTVYVVEVNGIPGWRGLQEATSINVAQAIVEHLVKRVGESGRLRT
jgi:RimK family alpha-L-glutamate ligase